MPWQLKLRDGCRGSGDAALTRPTSNARVWIRELVAPPTPIPRRGQSDNCEIRTTVLAFHHTSDQE